MSNKTHKIILESDNIQVINNIIDLLGDGYINKAICSEIPSILDKPEILLDQSNNETKTHRVQFTTEEDL